MSSRLLRSLRALVTVAAVLSLSSCGGSDPLSPADIIAMRFVTEPATIAAGATFAVSVEFVATGNRRVTAATDMVTLSADGGGTLGGPTSVAAVRGVATFTGLELTRAGVATLSAAGHGFSVSGAPLPVTSGAASAERSMVALTPATPALNGSTSAVFRFFDAFDNPLNGATVSLSATLNGVTFTPSAGTTNGDGTFGSTMLATALGTGTITANVGGNTITVGGSFTVVPAIAALRFVTPPVTTVAGQAFTVAVELVDAAGQRVTTATNQISVSITGVPLAGTTTVTAVAGVATFTGLTATAPTSNAVLTATSGTLSVQSAPFSFVAGPPVLAQSSLTFASTLSAGVASAGTFTIKDAFGNPVAAAAIALTSSIAGTTLTPASGTTSASGVFASSVNPGAAGAGTITATVGGVALAFPMLVCAAGSATIGTPVAGTVTVDNGCTLNNHAANVYRFSAPAGANATAVAVTGVGQGAFFPEITITPDPRTTTGTLFVGNTASAATNGPREWLLPSGSFLGAISSSNGNGGSFTLTLANNGVGAAGCRDPSGNARIMVSVNATYTGQSLATTDCADNSAGGPYYYDAFTLLDSRPCTITMQAAFGVFLEVQDANADVGLVDTPNTSATVTLTSCRTNAGQLFIVPSSHLGGITGPYTLTIAFTGSGTTSSLAAPNAAWMRSTAELMQGVRRRK